MNLGLIIVYSNMLQENSNNLLYAGFIEECVAALQLEETPLILVILTVMIYSLYSVVFTKVVRYRKLKPKY